MTSFKTSIRSKEKNDKGLRTTIRLNPENTKKLYEDMAKGESPSDVINRRFKNSLSRDQEKICMEVCKKCGVQGPSLIGQVVTVLHNYGNQHNGDPQSEEVEEEDDFFDCNRLCKRARQCTSNAMNHLGEIVASNCYVSKYPYEWTTPDGRTVKLCNFMFFPNGFPDDPENPYPVCRNPKPKLIIPKDGIIRDPQICWTCYKLQKRERQEKLYRKTVRDDYASKPYQNIDRNGNPWRYLGEY
jgi:hypothetical protein